MTELLTHFVLQIAVILLVAKLFGWIFEKFGQSSVLGELLAGMAIGPFALGMIDLPFIGKLFPMPHVAEIAEHGADAAHHAVSLPVSNELYMFAQLGAILLLFLVGLETDAKRFMKYGVKALGIAIGGVVLPFLLGAYGTVWFGFAEGIFDPAALFMGAIMTATSVGITARVLSDMYKLDTEEGVSILAAAVIDDIMGILILAVVLSLSVGGGEISGAELGMIGLKALGFIAVMVVLGIVFAKKISKWLIKMDDKIYLAVIVGICFLIAAFAEMFGLAMIIGAYLAGILMSETKIGPKVEEKLGPVTAIVVPVFFAVMGMLVDFNAMKGALLFGAVITVLAIIGKVVGSGFPALFSGFNKLGAIRIGIGMLPRGEVALIVAGIGLAAGVISQTIFGVSIMMTLITTLIAPLVLVPLFKNDKSGLKSVKEEKVKKPKEEKEMMEPAFKWSGDEKFLSYFRDLLLDNIKSNGYKVIIDDYNNGIFELENEQDEQKIVTITIKTEEMTLDCHKKAYDDCKDAIEDAKEMMEKNVEKFTLKAA